MDTIEQTLVEAVEVLARSVEAAEKSQKTCGVTLVYDDGTTSHIDFSRDPEPARGWLREAQQRLDTYRESLVY